MITVQFDYSAICDLLDIPHTYITGMRLEVDSADVDESKMGAFAVMRVELLRPLTKEEWSKVATLALEGTTKTPPLRRRADGG
jgi:hypothetical protein